jgi:outer membrane protein TolC
MAVVILVHSQPSYAQNSDNPDTEIIQLLNPWWSEALQANRGIQSSQASAAVKSGELDAAHAAFYPTLRASAEGGPSQTKLWNAKGPVTPENKTEWSAQAGLTASLNLYQGGLSLLRVDAAKNGVQVGNLELESTQASLATGMARELVTIWRQWRSLVESESLLGQAKTLQKIAVVGDGAGVVG